MEEGGSGEGGGRAVAPAEDPGDGAAGRGGGADEEEVEAGGAGVDETVGGGFEGGALGGGSAGKGGKGGGGAACAKSSCEKSAPASASRSEAGEGSMRKGRIVPPKESAGKSRIIPIAEAREVKSRCMPRWKVFFIGSDGLANRHARAPRLSVACGVVDLRNSDAAHCGKGQSRANRQRRIEEAPNGAQ